MVGTAMSTCVMNELDVGDAVRLQVERLDGLEAQVRSLPLVDVQLGSRQDRDQERVRQRPGAGPLPAGRVDGQRDAA